MHKHDFDVTMKISLGFGQLTAGVGDHIAHFYKGFHQRCSVLGPYVAEGIRSLVPNPLHIPPETLLQELAQRS